MSKNASFQEKLTETSQPQDAHDGDRRGLHELREWRVRRCRALRKLSLLILGFLSVCLAMAPPGQAPQPSSSSLAAFMPAGPPLFIESRDFATPLLLAGGWQDCGLPCLAYAEQTAMLVGRDAKSAARVRKIVARPRIGHFVAARLLPPFQQNDLSRNSGSRS